ncbi:hypothetical protein Y032_0020g163 [Ancylostoma ceylanicum]|uniref:Uncharacterized protein n=1 Tax=Ancylostoma ceylanicum TaxID=53326 RepID=A0A016UZY1_9BILA|nr:hypothetical protein Y032_0020g163 [Ancylostoma ceylanicum]
MINRSRPKQADLDTTQYGTSFQKPKPIGGFSSLAIGLVQTTQNFVKNAQFPQTKNDLSAWLTDSWTVDIPDPKFYCTLVVRSKL